MGFYTNRTFKYLSNLSDEDRKQLFIDIVNNTKFKSPQYNFIQRTKEENDKEWEWIEETDKSFLKFMKDNSIPESKWDYRLTPAGMINTCIREYNENIYEGLEKAFGYILYVNYDESTIERITTNLQVWLGRREKEDNEKACIFEIEKKCFNHTSDSLEGEYQAQYDNIQNFNKNHSIDISNIPENPDIVTIYYRDGIKLCTIYTKEQLEYIANKAKENNIMLLLEVRYNATDDKDNIMIGTLYKDGHIEMLNKECRLPYNYGE